MNEYRKSVWRMVGIFVIFSLALSTLSAVVGSSNVNAEAQRAVQAAILVVGFASIAVLIFILARLDRRKSDDAD